MTREITYRFELETGAARAYTLSFDETNQYLPPGSADLPVTPRPWTALDYCQCPHCPLRKAASPQCPIARNLDRVIEDFKETASYTSVKVTVLTPERTYVKDCDAQIGLRSMFGLLMASSGCPHLDWLRPLSRFHLPFADIEESLFRALSVYLVEAFLEKTKGSLDDCAKEIEVRYQKVELVNVHFIERVRNYCEKDADKNALAALDVFVQMFSLHSEENFRILRKYFGRQ